MRWTALFALILAIGGTAYEYVPCGQYPTTITSLDHATCIPEHFSGYADHNYVPWSHGSNCTSTVDVYTGCTCQDGNGVAGHNYCVYNVSRTIDDNTANVTIGLCGVGGRCYVYDFKAFMEVDLRNLQLAKRLNMFPLPPCVAPDLEVAAGIKVAAGCEFFCYGRQNKDINDGRICALEWYSGAISGEPIVTLTGSCHNGICRTSGLYDFPVQGKCHDSERYQHYGALLDKCTYKCPNGSEMQRPNYLPCLFRKKSFTKRDVLGLCLSGICSAINEVHPCEMNYISYWSNHLVRVAKSCKCHNRPLENGKLCALSYKFGIGGYLLREVGICYEGECRHRPPDRPPDYKFKKKECQVIDVQITPELTVAGACSSTCRRYEVEARPNGTLCLLQYTQTTYHGVRKKQTLQIGECWNGKCKYSANSFDITI